MTQKGIAAAALVASVLAFSPPGPAQARAVCDGEFQVDTGGAIATPYCADRYLAHVARTYGMRISAADVGNPGTKQRVCEFIGYDNRVYSICSGWRNDAGGRPRR